MRRTIRLLAVGALASSVVVALPAGADGHLETVLEGVDNGRGITFDAAGNLYVASSGVGGDGPCIAGPEGGDSCYGETGSIHRLAAADVGGATIEDAEDPAQLLLDDLPSHADETGGTALGPADVSVGADGRLYFTIGLGSDPAVRSDPDGFGPTAKGDLFATLHSAVAADGSDLRLEADLGTFEATEDPDGFEPDSNPFGVIADTVAGTATVADSGGNTVVAVPLGGGDLSAPVVLPQVFVPAPAFLEAPSGTNIPAQAVPTQHAIVNGEVALGQLTGFPFAPGAANVFQVDGDGASPWYRGFTNVIDVAQGPDGSMLVLEIAHQGLLNAGDAPPMGALIRVSEEDGTVTRELLVDDLLMPGGMAVHPTDGHVYITQGSAMPAAAPLPGAGTVVRYDLAGDPLLTVVDDSAATDEDERLVAGDAEDDQFTTVVADVLTNDTGAATATPLDVAQGAVTTGSIVYQPRAHFVGDDPVPYWACNDDDSDCLIGVLTVTVEGAATDRIAGETRIDTAVEASMGRYPDGAPAVLVARSDLYPDALAGGPLAKAVGGPILLTPGDTLAPATAAEIQRLGVGTVHVLGGPVAISDEVFDAIQALVPDTQRIAGENRYETAVEIKEALEAVTDSPTQYAFVVEGFDPDPNRGWPDAVAVSALAAWEGQPILLVETDRLPEETAGALAGIDATVIGGPVAISDATQAAIDAAADTVSEIAGDTRYHTSQLIAEAGQDLMLRGVQLSLVSGGNWPDALVAGPLAAGNPQHPLLLVHPTDIAGSPETVEFIEDNGPFVDVDLFGGPVAISAEVEAAIAAANQ